MADGNNLTLEEAKAFYRQHAKLTDRWSGRATEPQPDCCCARTADNYQCSEVTKVTLADGSQWCGRHSPSAVNGRAKALATRRAATQARYDAEYAHRSRVAKQRALEAKALPIFAKALAEIVELTARKQLPLTAQINEIAAKALADVGGTTDGH